MPSPSLQFDALSRMSMSDQPVPTGGVTVALKRAAESYGLDAVAELYNEALRLATEGHLAQSLERLRMLLVLSPEDGEANLLLAKVLVATQDFSGALVALDSAERRGIAVPAELRDAVRRHHAAEPDDAQRVRADGEIKAVRQEARRLRTENTELLARVATQERETRKWAWTTAAVSGLALLFIGINLLFGGSSEAVVASGAGEASPVAPAVAGPASPSGAASAVGGASGGAATAPPVQPQKPVRSADAVAMAAAALQEAPGLDGTRIEVTVHEGRAKLTGQVATHTQRKLAGDVVASISGVSGVDYSGVAVTARQAGATHTVRSGDNLSKIAYQYYGDASLAGTVLKANRKLLKGKTDLSIGQQLVIPPVQ